jgi:hypothetical protein
VQERLFAVAQDTRRGGRRVRLSSLRDPAPPVSAAWPAAEAPWSVSVIWVDFARDRVDAQLAFDLCQLQHYRSVLQVTAARILAQVGKLLFYLVEKLAKPPLYLPFHLLGDELCKLCFGHWSLPFMIPADVVCSIAPAGAVPSW